MHSVTHTINIFCYYKSARHIRGEKLDGESIPGFKICVLPKKLFIWLVFLSKLLLLFGRILGEETESFVIKFVNHMSK